MELTAHVGSIWHVPTGGRSSSKVLMRSESCSQALSGLGFSWALEMVSPLSHLRKDADVRISVLWKSGSYQQGMGWA